MDADEFKRTRISILFFEAQLDHFTGALHERVQVLGLRMAAVEGGNRCNEVAFFILLDENREFSLLLQVDVLFR